MAYKYFASRTIYQIVTTMESLFSLLILVFSSRTVKTFLDQEDAFQSTNRIVLYSGIVGILVSLVQIGTAAALIWYTRGPNAFDKDDLAVSRFPTLWFSLAFLNSLLLVFIFLGPLLLLEKKGQLRSYDAPLRQSLSDLFTYVVTNFLFKFLFIWAIFTTIRFRR